jgi:hypothetical protein
MKDLESDSSANLNSAATITMALEIPFNLFMEWKEDNNNEY